jgi:hypothetical protein
VYVFEDERGIGSKLLLGIKTRLKKLEKFLHEFINDIWFARAETFLVAFVVTSQKVGLPNEGTWCVWKMRA